MALECCIACCYAPLLLRLRHVMSALPCCVSPACLLALLLATCMQSYSLCFQRRHLWHSTLAPVAQPRVACHPAARCAASSCHSMQSLRPRHTPCPHATHCNFSAPRRSGTFHPLGLAAALAALYAFLLSTQAWSWHAGRQHAAMGGCATEYRPGTAGALLERLPVLM